MAVNAYQNGPDTVFIYNGYEKIVPGILLEMVANKGINLEKPRRCYLDLEMSMEYSIQEQIDGKSPLICWVITDDEGLVYNHDDITKIIPVLECYDQICAWNGEKYDFLVLQNILFDKADYRGPDPRRWLWLDQLKVFGRYHLVVESGAERESLALDHVAQSILGEGKHDIDLRHADYETILRYCIQDVKLLAKLEAKTHYIDLHYNVCKICNCFPDTRSLNPTHFVDSYLSRLANNITPLPEKKWSDRETVPYVGAYVMPPSCKGIQKNVDVIDFASMYPSIMISYNMSWETINRPGLTVESTGVSFSDEEIGIIPRALIHLIDARKAHKDEAMRTAYKVVANSFYGVVGSSYSRFYNRKIAESVTLEGQRLLKLTIEAAKTAGYNVIYGDTDSLLIENGTNIQEFVTHCNKTLIPEWVKSPFNVIKLAYDKHYDRMVFIAAKKYVGLCETS